MKFLKLTIVALVIPTIMFAQQIKTATNELRTIEVIGAASTSLPPNVINVNFVIKEFTNNAETVSIDASEATVLRILKDSKASEFIRSLNIATSLTSLNFKAYILRSSYLPPVSPIEKPV